MSLQWILQEKECNLRFANATWIPLRALVNTEVGVVSRIGYRGDYFGCGSVAFHPEKMRFAEQLEWVDIGLFRDVLPYAYDDGYYSSIEQYQYNDKESIGVHLVFDHPQPVTGGRRWILNPDLVVALRLVKEGDHWVRPEENYEIVVRERFDPEGNHQVIEIKRTYLVDYLAARGMMLRLSYYRQRVLNIKAIEGSPYAELVPVADQRYDGRFEIRIARLADVFGGSWSALRVWRTDIDADEDAPVMGPENDTNTECESSQGRNVGPDGVRIESEFWRAEWVEHQGNSVRVRGDADPSLPTFIVGTSGERLALNVSNNEDIGRWLWFRSDVINALLDLREFRLEWYTSQTGCIHSTSGHSTHFGINDADLITVNAHDIAELMSWEQQIWAAQSVVPDGKLSTELFASQVKTQPASTKAVEVLLLAALHQFRNEFENRHRLPLFTQEIDLTVVSRTISRFNSRDLASLLGLAKELVKVFSDRLSKKSLLSLSSDPKGNELGSNKLLQSILAQKIGVEEARSVFEPIFGTYDMRNGDAHPTSSKINEAILRAGINTELTFLRQGEQLIRNYGKAICEISSLLFQGDEQNDLEL